jgi:hypothetical protein
MKIKNLFSALKKSPITASIIVGSVFVALVFLSTYLLYLKAKDSLIQEIKIGLESSVSAAATTINGDNHSTFTKNTSRIDSLYLSEILPLENIRKNSKDIRYIYTNILVDGKVYFMYNPSPQNDNDNDGLEDIAPALMDIYNDPAPELLEVLEKQISKVTNVYVDEWGTFISAYAPFYNSKGEFIGALGMDQELSNYYKRLEPIEVAFEKTVSIILFIGLVIGLLIWYLRKHSKILEERNEENKFNEKELTTNLNNSYKQNSSILTNVKNNLDCKDSTKKTALENTISAIAKYQDSMAGNYNNKLDNFNLEHLFESVKQIVAKENITVEYNYKTMVDKIVYGLSIKLYEDLMCNLIMFLVNGSQKKSVKIDFSQLDEGIDDFKLEAQFLVDDYPTIKEDFLEVLNPDLSSYNLLLENLNKLETITLINQLKENNVNVNGFKNQNSSGISMKFKLKKAISNPLQ